MTQAGSEIDRLPRAGAGFVWAERRNGVEPFPVLLPVLDTGMEVSAAFTTRLGGVSQPPVHRLNVSLVAQMRHSRDPAGPLRVFANRDIAGRTIGADGRWPSLRQVHGARVAEAGMRGEADAVWTDDPARTLAVTSADCVLILLTGLRGVAVVHAGWRGLLAGVVEEAATTIGAERAWAGPAIGPCCFEVSDDVAGPYRERFGRQVMADDRHADLWSATESAAERAGVTETRLSRVCTSCHPELFFSHRRDDGRTGRQALVARVGA